MRLITPKRLKESEEHLWDLADQVIDEFIARGECELIQEYAIPYTLLVIADLLGVPDEDREAFRANLIHRVRPAKMEHKPLGFLYEQFTAYIADRRREPRNDIMTEMAQATFPDGTLPEVDEVAKIAANLFSAGGETTARLITMCMRTLGDHPEFQQRLRDDNELISAFIEEMLRTEAPLKGSFKLSRVPTTVGGVDLPAGTTVFVMTDAASRDPRQFECPAEFRLDRVNGRQHLAFGHGIHTCAGAPLACGDRRHDSAFPRADRRHPRVGCAPRLDRGSALRVRPHLHAPRPPRVAPGVHTRWVTPTSNSSRSPSTTQCSRTFRLGSR